MRDFMNKRSPSQSKERESKHFFFEKKKQKTLAFWVACGGGSGVFPWAPGSVGSLVGLGIGVLLLHVSPLLLAGGATFAIIAGYVAIRAALPGMEADADPGWVVIDEIAGQMLALLALHRIGWMGVALAFALFRVFDVWKPGPVGWADRQGGAWGIMADDVLAGGLAALVLLGVQATVPLA